MANIRDEILKLTNPEPVFKDPEDNSDDGKRIFKHFINIYIESLTDVQFNVCE